MSQQLDNYPVVSLAELEELVIDTALSPRPRPTLAFGDPGTGKTQTSGRISARIRQIIADYRYVPVEAASTPWEEIGGIPGRVEGSDEIRRYPLSVVKGWTAPSLAHVDEFGRADPGRQGAYLTVIQDRRAGDTFIHPQTAFLLTTNKPDSSGTFSILDTVLNRCCNVVVHVSREESRAYFRGAVDALKPVAPLNPAVYARELARLKLQYADFSEGRPEMFAEGPPRGFVESGALWPNGRAVEHGLERVAARIARGESGTDSLALTHVAGCIGRETAVLWHRLTELLGKLPSAKEIEADPANCIIPTDAESAVSALALLSTVKADALWLWLHRWPASLAELQAAGAKKSVGKVPTNAQSLRAFNAINASIHRASVAR